MRDFDAIKKKEMSSIENRIRHIYNVGYEDCLKDQQNARDEAYKQGLHDAWICARKICANWCVSDKTLNEIFGNGKTIDDIMNEFSPSEAIEKFKEYDAKTSDDPDNSKIEVGDVVETNGFSKPVIVISVPDDNEDSTEIKVMNFLGDTAWKNMYDCKKTGKHIQQIEEVFNMLRENKNA